MYSGKMRLHHHFLCRQLFTALVSLYTLALATSSFPLPSPTHADSTAPPTSTHSHNHSLKFSLDKRHDDNNSRFDKDIPKVPPFAITVPAYTWVDYYSTDYSFMQEQVLFSGDCLTFPPALNWSIINVVPLSPPASNEVDLLTIYRDPACLNAIIGPAARTSNVLVSEYFRRNDPMSINWIRYLPVDASATANTTTISNPTPTNSSSKAVPTTTIPTPATSLPPFPSSMVPPRTTGRWCDGDSSRKCGGDNTDKKTNNVLIVSITVAVLTLGFLAAAAFYIYRTFYAPDSNSNITGTTTISKSSTHSNSKTLRDNDPEPDNPSRLVDTFLYNRAKEESTRNINTNKDPKLFRESPKSSRTAYSSNPAIQIPLQQRSKGGQTSPSSEVSLLARTKH